MKKLTLDYSKWRCGSDGPNRLGRGETSLLNQEGFMCCLGQWALQLGAEEKNLMSVGVPEDTNQAIEGLNYETVFNGEKSYSPTRIAQKAIYINDDKKTSPAEKIEQLKALCFQHDFELEVINQPT